MLESIIIKTADIEIKAQLNQSPTAKAIAQALPIDAAAQRWGGEIYFTIPVSAPLEPDARDILQPGELAYWPTGNAFCIFFGKTPASKQNEIRAASNVNIIGKITQDLTPLWDVPDNAKITITNHSHPINP